MTDKSDSLHLVDVADDQGGEEDLRERSRHRVHRRHHRRAQEVCKLGREDGQLLLLPTLRIVVEGEGRAAEGDDDDEGPEDDPEEAAAG